MIAAAAAAFVLSVSIVALYLRGAAKDESWFAGKKVAHGTVVRCEPNEDEYGYWSEIEYPANRQKYRITGDFELTPADVGKTMPIAYDPQTPSEARLIQDRKPRLDAGAVFLFVFLWIAFFLAAMTIRAFVGD